MKKSILRRKFLILFIFIIGFISLYLISGSIIQFFGINNHFKEQVGDLIAVGKITPISEDIGRENLEFLYGEIENNPLIERVFHRKYYSAWSEPNLPHIRSLYNRFMWDDFNALHDEMIFAGTISDIEEFYPPRLDNPEFNIKLRLAKQYAGRDAFFRNPDYKIRVFSKYPTDWKTPSYYDENLVKSIRELKVGETYIFRAFMNTYIGTETIWFLPLTDDEYYIEYKEDIVLEPKLKQRIDAINYTANHLLAFPTCDMNENPEFLKGFNGCWISSGRGINEADVIEKRRVVVVNNYFTWRTHLDIGDSIKLSFVNMGDGNSYPITDYEIENFKNFPKTEPEEYEIIGKFESIEKDYNQAVEYNIYVPESVIPENYEFVNSSFQNLDEEYKNLTLPEHFSYVLKAPLDEQKFIDEFNEKYSEYGFQAEFITSNIEIVTLYESALENQRQSLLYRIFSLILILFASVFILFFTLIREYGILRAMGIRSGDIFKGFAMVLPIYSIGGFVGAFLSIKEAIDFMKEQYSAVPSIKPGIFALVIVIVIYYLLFYAGHNKLMKMAIFDLFTEKGNKNKSIIEKSTNKEDLGEIKSFKIKENRTLGKKFISKIGITHLLKRKIFYIYIVLISVILIGYLITNQMMVESTKEIERYYEETSLSGKIEKKDRLKIVIGKPSFVPDSLIQDIENLGIVESEKLETKHEYADISAITREEQWDMRDIIEISSQWEIHTVGKNVKPSEWLDEVEFEEGFDEEGFNEGRGILANKNKVRPLNLNIGDKVIFHTYDSIYSKDITVPIVGIYEVEGGLAENEWFVVPIELTKRLEPWMRYYSAEFEFKKSANRHLIENIRDLEIMVTTNPYGIQDMVFTSNIQDIKEKVESLQKSGRVLSQVNKILLYILPLLVFFFAYIHENQHLIEIRLMKSLGVRNKDIRANMIMRYVVLLSIIILITLIANMIIKGSIKVISTPILLFIVFSFIGTLFAELINRKKRVIISKN